ncbi:MAG: acetylxylan esterase [Armatimonadota bacterium]|nr:MAG: acetylxylan esterase [Armatimonadota bacterium]
MPRKITSLLRESDKDQRPTELPYRTMLKDLACEAMQRVPLYDYRGKSARAVRERIVEVRRIVARCLGLSSRDIPAKPVRVSERPAVQFDGFSIKPVVIQRRPGWHISAHLYIPDNLTQPAPAVMHVHGHSYEGKATDFYARRCRGLARRGFVVLFLDFPEADERKGTGHALWYPVLAYLPLQGIMALDNSAALTYLAGLRFVDEKRIGVTGSSGGGNQTVYFSAVDERVAASAPTNAPTIIAEHARTGSGAYCHCEAIPGLLAAGVEYHDLLAATAPRPQRVFAGIRDPLFPIIGARKAVAEAAIAYRALRSAPCTIEEHYCEHACPADMREGTYRFFERALKRPGDVRGPRDEGEDVDLADPRLRALPKRPARFLTVADLYRARLRGIRPKRAIPVQLNRLLGRRAGDSRVQCRVRAEGQHWSRILLETNDGAMLPLAIRGSAPGRLVLAIADEGKQKALQRLGNWRGRVATFDWRGQGETAPPQDEWYQRASHYLAFAGQTLAGGRVTDLIAVARWVEREGFEVTRIAAFGGEASIIALLAASVDSDLPRVELHGLARTLKDAPGLIGQVKYTAWVPGLALVTDIPQLLKGLRGRAVVRRWLRPGEEKPREGYT